MKWEWETHVKPRLITGLETFTSGVDETASSLFHSMCSFLSEEQTLTLLRFFREKERYEGVGVRVRVECRLLWRKFQGYCLA